MTASGQWQKVKRVLRRIAEYHVWLKKWISLNENLVKNNLKLQGVITEWVLKKLGM